MDILKKVVLILLGVGGILLIYKALGGGCDEEDFDEEPVCAEE